LNSNGSVHSCRNYLFRIDGNDRRRFIVSVDWKCVRNDERVVAAINPNSEDARLYITGVWERAYDDRIDEGDWFHRHVLSAVEHTHRTWDGNSLTCQVNDEVRSLNYGNKHRLYASDIGRRRWRRRRRRRRNRASVDGLKLDDIPIVDSDETFCKAILFLVLI